MLIPYELDAISGQCLMETVCYWCKHYEQPTCCQDWVWNGENINSAKCRSCEPVPREEAAVA